MLPNREAGLPMPMEDQDGIYNRYAHYLGVVRAIDMDLRRVDVEPQEGGLLRSVQVEGDVMPEIYQPTELPSYVTYWFHDGNLQDPCVPPVHWRRFKGPEMDEAPEREKYHEHLQIRRVGDITIRITKDGKKIYLYDAESGDYCLYDQDARTFHVIGPHVFIGTDEKNRAELHTETDDDRLRVVIPKALIGEQAVADTDGITYLAQQLIHLFSAMQVKATAGAEINLIAPFIKLTADSVVVDPVSIRFGHANATERLMLGDLWKAFYNVFITLFNSHSHTNVQNGLSSSGPPAIPASLMDDSTLSTIAKISQ